MHEFDNWHWENDIPVHEEGRRTCSAKPGM